ncbi:hypothetical protein SRABI70_01267 [Pseudomonas sp. Bi70]|nr:hypothetical protein SRABI70_01267 [Pseudomonas sp. Bi70]
MHAPAQQQTEILAAGSGVAKDLTLLSDADAHLRALQVGWGDTAAGQQLVDAGAVLAERIQGQYDGVEGGQVGVLHGGTPSRFGSEILAISVPLLGVAPFGGSLGSVAGRCRRR